jgi:hypothetical protein
MAEPASAAAANITFVNGTGGPLREIRVRSVGGEWSLLGPGMSPGARITKDVATDICAFDVRAALAGGGEVVWSRLNLCEVKVVTLNRRDDGTSWADYD